MNQPANLDKLLENKEEAARLVHALREEALKRCAKDGWFFTQFVKTRDEADQDSVKSYPQLEYLKELWEVISTNQRVAIAKSRQMFVSWALCTYCVWFARFHSNKYIVWQTQKAEDAHKMVCMAGGDKDTGYFGRMQFIERNLPSWLRQPLKETAGVLGYPNGSMIEAVAGGANQVRGKTASLIVEDEFAYQEEAKGVYQAVAPLIQKATKFIAVSTPNGPSNTFALLYHGHNLISFDEG